MTDIEIARSVSPKKIVEIAASVGLDENSIEPYGHYKAKVDPAQVKGERLTVEIPLSLTLLAWESVKERAIFSSSVLAESEKRDEAAFTVYFPSVNESLWDIAKKYKISSDRLVLTGGENGGSHRRALILPPKSKELFSGVIT